MPSFPFAGNVHDKSGEDDLAGGCDPEEKLAEMREFGIDYGVLDPTLNLGLPTVENSRVAVALANASSSWILDEYTDEDEAFVANVLVPHKRPAEAAEEIDRRAGEDGIVGVQIPSTGVLPPLSDPRYDPIYEAAEDDGLPVVLHGGTSPPRTPSPPSASGTRPTPRTTPYVITRSAGPTVRRRRRPRIAVYRLPSGDGGGLRQVGLRSEGVETEDDQVPPGHEHTHQGQSERDADGLGVREDPCGPVRRSHGDALQHDHRRHPVVAEQRPDHRPDLDDALHGEPDVRGHQVTDAEEEERQTPQFPLRTPESVLYRPPIPDGGEQSADPPPLDDAHRHPVRTHLI